MKDLKVIKFTEDCTFPISIINASDIQKVEFRDTYDRYGQKNGEVLDYCLANLEGSFWTDLKQALQEKFGGIVDWDELEADGSPNDIVDDYVYVYGEFDKSEEVKSFITNFIKKNESFVSVEAFTFWDGSNFASLIVGSDEVEGDIEVLDSEDEESIAILSAFEDVDQYLESADKIEKIGGFEFYLTRFANDPFIARIK